MEKVLSGLMSGRSDLLPTAKKLLKPLWEGVKDDIFRSAPPVLIPAKLVLPGYWGTEGYNIDIAKKLTPSADHTNLTYHSGEVMLNERVKDWTVDDALRHGIS